MAVISALLVVAAVTMITASLLQRQDAFLRGVQAAQNRAQAQALLRGGLNQALRLIKEDGERNATTRGDAPWAAPITDARLAATAGGQPVFLGRLEDEQGKLNLRNLVFEGKLYQDGVEELARLCQSLGLRRRSRTPWRSACWRHCRRRIKLATARLRPYRVKPGGPTWRHFRAAWMSLPARRAWTPVSSRACGPMSRYCRVSPWST
ncbi:hypothetical protein WJ968_06210 [Achromobacter xylosoxidans]